MKTRGLKPNPTTQAQSKRCLPLFTKTQNIIKILPAGLPNPIVFWYLFRAFSLLVSQDTNMDPKGTQIEPKGAEMKPQSLSKVPKSLPTIPHVCQNGSPRCHNGGKRPPKVPKRHHKALQSATKTQKTCTNHPRPGARRRRRRSGRGSEGRPTRLHVEVPIEGLRYKYTRALFLKSINWVPPLTPTLADPICTRDLGYQKDPKRRQKNIEKSKGTKGGPKSENKGPEP